MATNNFFTAAFTSGTLTAPSTTTAGGNGVYTYGGTNTAGIFPTNTFGAANYWADVVFASSVANTPPTAVADTASATEKGGVANGSGGSPASGNVLTNDTDPDAGDTKTVTAVSFGAVAGTLGTALAGAHGSLVLNAAGAFTYTVNETDAAVQALRQSTDTLTDVFSYTMRDAAGATSTTTLTVTIHGANDAPTLAVQTSGQNAVVGSAFSLVLPAGTFTDVDAGDTLTYAATAADGSPLPAWLTFNAATRTFSGTPAAANVGTLSVKATATDLGGLAASETFNIVVTTTPDAAPTAVADAADATEKGGIANGSGGSPASGNVLTNDTDPDAGDTKTVTAVSFGAVAGTLGTALAGAHGSLVLNAAGDFTYTVNENDAAVQALRQSTDTLTDAFSYTMRDAAGVTSTTTLTVSIHGANDAPTLAVQTGGQNAVVGSAFSLVLPAGTFTDVDAGDTLTYAATAADGSPLPAWLAFNAATRTFSGTPTAANVGTLSVKVTATDLGGLAASETFNIVVTTAAHDGQPLHRFQYAGADQSERWLAARSRREVPVLRCRPDHRAQVLSQRQRHRRGHPRLVDDDRDQSRQRDVHEHRRERLADREPDDARHDIRQHDLCRLVSHDRLLCGDRQLLHHRLHQRCADSTLHHHGRWQRRLRLGRTVTAAHRTASSRPTLSARSPTITPTWCSPACGEQRAGGDQPVGGGELHRRHPAQPHQHRGERCRQCQCDGDPDAVQPGRGQPDHGDLGRGNLDLHCRHRRLDRLGRDR